MVKIWHPLNDVDPCGVVIREYKVSCTHSKLVTIQTSYPLAHTATMSTMLKSTHTQNSKQDRFFLISHTKI